MRFLTHLRGLRIGFTLTSTATSTIRAAQCATESVRWKLVRWELARWARYSYLLVCALAYNSPAQASPTQSTTQSTSLTAATPATNTGISTTALSDVAVQPELSVVQAQQAMAQAQLTSLQLTQYYLRRITQLDQTGPQLRALIELNPDALAQARLRDEERAQGKVRSALHGIPLVLKANIATADHLATSAGSLALAGFHATHDAPLVTQLRAAGAVILGKSNLSEWANFRGRHSSSGWSSLGGQTLNPYVLNRTPCGSSAGSAVAVSADLSLLAVGTETNGSITCPAAMNSVVGMKPTWGAVSGQGIIPIARSQDTAGPLARSVSDAATLLEFMLSPQGSERLGADFAKLAATGQLRGARIGWVSGYNNGRPAVAQMVNAAVAKAQALGAEMVEITQWQLHDEVYDDAYFALSYEFKHDINAWLEESRLADGRYPAGFSQLDELIRFNREHRAQVLSFFGQEYMLAAQALKLEQEAANWRRARQRSQDASRQLIDQTLRQHQLSAILLPAYGPPWLIDHVQGDQFDFGTSTAAALAGYPSITFPGGWQGELPLGLSLIASAWQERTLIALAGALEQSLQARHPPQFIPSVEAQHAAPAVLTPVSAE